jgi:hypothetical protein
LSIVVRQSLGARGLAWLRKFHQGSGDIGSGLINDFSADASGSLLIGLLRRVGGLGVP